MCVALRDRDERAFSPYERVPTDAQKGRRKQEENERRILKSSLFLSLCRSLSSFLLFFNDFY